MAEMTLDRIREGPNPYDFANPVADLDLFAGRQSELRQINYYLGQAKSAARPINLAILGPRASGKTSLLNMCEGAAKKLDLCTARIDLDEGDAESQLTFFHKVFDATLSAGCERGAFGGLKGRTYETYIDMVNTFDIPDDKTFCPFLFPMQYAKALGAGNARAPFSDQSFRRDLRTIQTEVDVPLLLLFDEGNVLAKSRVHLEKLRNLFMNTPGYMLVLTGTPELFPVIDEVFSPIVRQFKKINIAGFRDRKETTECVEKPLRDLRIEARDLVNSETYNDIHELSGGRPYEIQLICHMLFRRVQTRRARTMRLNVGVLEDVRQELEQSQDITTRRLISKVRTLEPGELEALGLLTVCDGRASFDELWASHAVFKAQRGWSEDLLKARFEEFLNDEILRLAERDAVSFPGDEFDKIYLKYHARELGVSLRFWELDLEHLWDFLIFRWARTVPNLETLASPIGVGGDIPELAAQMEAETADLFVENPWTAERLYMALMELRHDSNPSVYRVDFRMPWVEVESWHYYPSRHPSGEPSLGEAVQVLHERASAYKSEITLTQVPIPRLSADSLVEQVHHSANERAAESLAEYHNAQLVSEYVSFEDADEAAFHAEMSLRLNPDPHGEDTNNIGYAFLSHGNYNRSRSLFEKAAEMSEESSIRVLSLYNLATANARLGRQEDARQALVGRTHNSDSES